MVPPQPSDAQIPVRVAEMLFVAFSMTLDEIERCTDYPRDLIDNMREMLRAYEADRTKALKGRGLNDFHVKSYTEGATKKLLAWVLEKEAKAQTASQDFNRWTEELKDEPQDRT